MRFRFRRASGGRIPQRPPGDDVPVLISPGVAFVSYNMATGAVDPTFEVVVVDGDLSDPAVQRGALDEYFNWTEI